SLAGRTKTGGLVNAARSLNASPVLSAIPDQTIALSSTATVTLSATDPDGDPLTYSAQANSLAYLLKSKLGLSTNGNYYLNWGGKNEKRVLGNGAVWYFILPNGQFYLWDGSSTATGTLVANLDASYWTDPTLLLNASSVTVPVTLSVSGNRLT